MNNQENLQRSVAVRPCVTEALIAPPSGKQPLKTQHRDVTRYLNRKMQSVISGSYSALDTSGLCWSVLADRVRLYIQTVVGELSHTAGGVAGRGGEEAERWMELHTYKSPIQKHHHCHTYRVKQTYAIIESCSLRG